MTTQTINTKRPRWLQEGGVLRNHPARTWGTLALLLGILFILSGCGGRTPELRTTIDTTLDTTIAEIQGMNLAELEVSDLTVNVGKYLAVYQAQYAVQPRRAATPLGIAEAYLREYQPGPEPRVFQTTVLYDRNGTKLAEIVDEGYRTWIPLSRISPNFINALLATEDATFYENPGYDARRVVGAMMQNAEAGEVISGASTVTMQLARQLFFSPTERFEQTLDRKVFEALLAQDLTLTYTKDEILEMYLNLVHFGRTVYGIEAAANLYFNKNAASLTIAEATLLAGIPQAPADYDPFNNFDAIKQRQGVVLNLMVRHGYLTRVEADAVFATELPLNPNPGRPPLYAPHFVQYVTSEVNRLRPGQDMRRSGMRIFTTLDLPMQTLAQQIVREQVTALQPVFDLSNAALVALKPGTAEILAMVGSADFYNMAIAGQVNVAVSDRQPGSAIKPILYALAMNDLQISPATIIWDVEARYDLDPTEQYTPRNYDSRFHGPVTVRTALANSYNIPAVKLLDAVGVERMLEGAREMGIHSLTRDTNWYGLSLTLGGGEVTLLDLTTAFHTLANGGRYQAPQSILYSTGAPGGNDFNGVISPPMQVISPESAYLVTNILSDNNARLPAFGENSLLRLDQPAVAKTGTTTDWRDNWTQGYTRYLVAGVWAGNSDGRPMRNASGVTGAAPIWNAFMQAVLADPKMLALLDAPTDPAEWEFVAPAGIVQQPIVCPSGITCAEEEIFDQRWLELMGEDEALADSVVVANMNMVYVNRGRGNAPMGACSDDTGRTRQLLRLPVGLTRSLEQLDQFDQLETAGNDLSTALVADASFSDTEFTETVESAELPEEDEELLRRIRDEQLEALAWSARQGVPLYFGDCAQVETVVRRIYGNSVVSVDIAQFREEVATVEEVVAREEPDESDEPRVQQSRPVATAAPQQASAGRASSSYSSTGVAHDTSCGGDYVLGSVYSSQGELIPSVAVIYSDDLGNRNYAAAVNGAYRFAVASPGTPHNIYISLQDAAGNSVSGTATIPHRQGGASDLGCHYVVWQGVD